MKHQVLYQVHYPDLVSCFRNCVKSCPLQLFFTKDKEAMEFLREIGPDTLVPCFSVNIKGNKDVNICNQINDILFKDLVHTDDEMTAHRTPMIVTASTMLHHRHSSALTSFKKRLGVSHNTTTKDNSLSRCNYWDVGVWLLVQQRCSKLCRGNYHISPVTNFFRRNVERANKLTCITQWMILPREIFVPVFAREDIDVLVHYPPTPRHFDKLASSIVASFICHRGLKRRPILGRWFSEIVV